MMAALNPSVSVGVPPHPAAKITVQNSNNDNIKRLIFTI
jgi:hypothetical protein